MWYVPGTSSVKDWSRRLLAWKRLVSTQTVLQRWSYKEDRQLPETYSLTYQSAPTRLKNHVSTRALQALASRKMHQSTWSCCSTPCHFVFILHCPFHFLSSIIYLPVGEHIVYLGIIYCNSLSKHSFKHYDCFFDTIWTFWSTLALSRGDSLKREANFI